MKLRLRHLFLTLFLLLAALPAPGQGKVYTRKLRLADFPARTTKVVLGGNPFLELTLREAVAVHWRISPYEFCTPEEYGRLAFSSSYYFLTLAQDRGILFLILSKGGKEGEKDQLKQTFEVVRIPIAGADDPGGRELVLMGAFLDIIQRFIEEAMTSDRVSYGGLSAYSRKLLRDKGKKLVLSEDDLASNVKQDPSWSESGIRILDEDDADALFTEGAENVMVSYVVAPTDPGKGAVCYKMVISADTHELCYFEKHVVKGNAPAGFLPFDLKIISLQRK